MKASGSCKTQVKNQLKGFLARLSPLQLLIFLLDLLMFEQGLDVMNEENSNLILRIAKLVWNEGYEQHVTVLFPLHGLTSFILPINPLRLAIFGLKSLNHVAAGCSLKRSAPQNRMADFFCGRNDT